MNDATGPGLTDELLEDCLQAVHRIVTQGRAAEVGEVAAFAHVSPTEVEAAISDLRTRGLVVADLPDRIILTREGQRLAAGILRRHRLSERLLTDVLGLPWDRVHEEAMRLEHSLTPEAEARLRAHARIVGAEDFEHAAHLRQSGPTGCFCAPWRVSASSHRRDSPSRRWPPSADHSLSG